jgi:Protein of unknown function (DUF4199)
MEQMPLDSSKSQNQVSLPSAMSVGLRYGLILGVISIVYTMVLIAAGSNPFVQDWKAYVHFIFIIGAIVMAHKFYKDNGDSYLPYGTGFGIAFVTVVVSMIMGMIFSIIYVKFVDTGAMDAMYDKIRTDMEEKGQGEQADMAIEWTRKLFWVFYVLGSLFYGAIIGLIVTIFTQKKRPVTF